MRGTDDPLVTEEKEKAEEVYIMYQQIPAFWQQKQVNTC